LDERDPGQKLGVFYLGKYLRKQRVGSELKHRSLLGSSSDPVSDAVVDAAERVPTEAWVRKHESSVGPRSIAAGWGIG